MTLKVCTQSDVAVHELPIFEDVSARELAVASLDSGEKPRVKGRESCLFLEAGGARVVL